MRRYLLDTNIVSYIIRGASPRIARRLERIQPSAICVSAVTEAELWFGVSRKPGATRLVELVEAFLARVEVLDWDRPAARSYGEMRAELERAGRGIGNMDLMITAHAKACGAILVTHDAALSRLPHVAVETWEREVLAATGNTR